MYEFHYDYMIPKYARSASEAHGDKLKLCYMDTDSLIYSIETKVYKDIANDVESRFDTSGYPNDGLRPLPIGKNKKVIGLMKDELGGEIIKEFISLRPKMYSYRVGSSEPKKCKGIKKCVVKKTKVSKIIKNAYSMEKRVIEANYYSDLVNTKLEHQK